MRCWVRLFIAADEITVNGKAMTDVPHLLCTLCPKGSISCRGALSGPLIKMLNEHCRLCTNSTQPSFELTCHRIQTLQHKEPQPPQAYGGDIPRRRRGIPHALRSTWVATRRTAEGERSRRPQGLRHRPQSTQLCAGRTAEGQLSRSVSFLKICFLWSCTMHVHASSEAIRLHNRRNGRFTCLSSSDGSPRRVGPRDASVQASAFPCQTHCSVPVSPPHRRPTVETRRLLA